MIRFLFFILFLISAQTYKYNNQECQCLNGGICTNSYFQTPCECPPLQIGRYCETKARSIGDSFQANIGYLDLDFNFQYFVFLPKEGNYFKFTFNVCTIKNIKNLDCLIFMTSDQQDGSPSYEPPIISAAKIKAKQGTCSSFESPYIQIKKNIPSAFRRIVIGVKMLQKDLKSYFYRTVTGKYLHEISQEILDNQPCITQHSRQRLHVSFAFEHYKQTFMESLIRKLIKVIITIAILMTTFLFFRILFFSYGIDIKNVLLKYTKVLRSFCKKCCPSKANIRSYRNYLKFKAMTQDEQDSELADQDQCAICLQNFSTEDIIQQTACRHIYHQTCLEQWQLKNQVCPLCRQKIIKIEEKWLVMNR